jgi:hypothetical protein
MQDEEAILYDIVLKRTKCAVIAITGKSGIERMLIHLGDLQGHNSTRTMERLDEFYVTLLPDPSDQGRSARSIIPSARRRLLVDTGSLPQFEFGRAYLSVPPIDGNT